MTIFRYAVQIKKKGIWMTVNEFNHPEPWTVRCKKYWKYRIWDKMECRIIMEFPKNKSAEECFQDLKESIIILKKAIIKAIKMSWVKVCESPSERRRSP